MSRPLVTLRLVWVDAEAGVVVLVAFVPADVDWGVDVVELTVLGLSFLPLLNILLKADMIGAVK